MKEDNLEKPLSDVIHNYMSAFTKNCLDVYEQDVDKYTEFSSDYKDGWKDAIQALREELTDAPTGYRRQTPDGYFNCIHCKCALEYYEDEQTGDKYCESCGNPVE